MKNLSIVPMLIGLSVFSQNLLAEASRVAVVDPVRAIAGTTQAKSEMENLEKELSAEKIKIDNLGEEIKKLQQKQQKDAAFMSEEQNRKLVKELEGKKIDFTFLAKSLRKRGQEGQNRILSDIRPKFDEAVRTIAEKKKIDIVLQSHAVAWLRDEGRLDITDSVTKKMNEL